MCCRAGAARGYSIEAGAIVGWAVPSICERLRGFFFFVALRFRGNALFVGGTSCPTRDGGSTTTNRAVGAQRVVYLVADEDELVRHHGDSGHHLSRRAHRYWNAVDDRGARSASARCSLPREPAASGLDGRRRDGLPAADDAPQRRTLRDESPFNRPGGRTTMTAELARALHSRASTRSPADRCAAPSCSTGAALRPSASGLDIAGLGDRRRGADGTGDARDPALANTRSTFAPHLKCARRIARSSPPSTEPPPASAGTRGGQRHPDYSRARGGLREVFLTSAWRNCGTWESAWCCPASRRVPVAEGLEMMSPAVAVSAEEALGIGSWPTWSTRRTGGDARSRGGRRSARVVARGHPALTSGDVVRARDRLRAGRRIEYEDRQPIMATPRHGAARGDRDAFLAKRPASFVDNRERRGTTLPVACASRLRLSASAAARAREVIANDRTHPRPRSMSFGDLLADNAELRSGLAHPVGAPRRRRTRRC